MKKILVAILLLLLVVSGTSYAGQASLTWDAPTTNVDGTPLTDLAGYKVYFGTASGVYGPAVDVKNVTVHTVTGLSEGIKYFVVTAYDTSGNESAYSNEVSKNIVVKPGCPNNLKIN